jgi:acetyl esterase/lipase
MRTLAYGASPEQVGDLYIPETAAAPLVCLLHGGFWRMPYGREQLDDLARDLCASGLAVWNLEYRRVGAGGSPWPATLRDIQAILEYIPTVAQVAPTVKVSRRVLVGHSAGGHLAFWAATRAAGHRQPKPEAVIGLAPILDLVAAHARGLGNNAAEAFLGGSPEFVPERYQEASPRAQLPLGVTQYIIHGDADVAVPVCLSREYADAARRAGDEATCIVLPDTDHMAFLDPRTEACRVLRENILRVVGQSVSP